MAVENKSELTILKFITNELIVGRVVKKDSKKITLEYPLELIENDTSSSAQLIFDCRDYLFGSDVPNITVNYAHVLYELDSVNDETHKIYDRFHTSKTTDAF